MQLCHGLMPEVERAWRATWELYACTPPSPAPPPKKKGKKKGTRKGAGAAASAAREVRVREVLEFASGEWLAACDGARALRC